MPSGNRAARGARARMTNGTTDRERDPRSRSGPRGHAPREHRRLRCTVRISRERRVTYKARRGLSPAAGRAQKVKCASAGPGRARYSCQAAEAAGIGRPAAAAASAPGTRGPPPCACRSCPSLGAPVLTRFRARRTRRAPGPIFPVPAASRKASVKRGRADSAIAPDAALTCAQWRQRVQVEPGRADDEQQGQRQPLHLPSSSPRHNLQRTVKNTPLISSIHFSGSFAGDCATAMTRTRISAR